MAGNHKPRKPYRPRQIRIPVTGLRNEFGLVLHTAYTAAALGYFSKEQYDRIGQAINCLYGALVLRPPKDAAVTIVIEGAMRAMNEAGRRGDATNVWALRDTEQAALLAGIKKAEEHLPRMDVMTLHESMQRIKAMGPEVGQDARRVFLGVDPASSRGVLDLINDEEELRIRELISAETWPDGWDGDEPRADEFMPVIYYQNGAEQHDLFGLEETV